MNFAIIIAFLCYVSVLIGISLLFYRKAKNAKEFMLGGRSINYFVTAIATQAGDMSSWLFLGFPGALFLSGIVELWTAIGLVSGMFLNWQFIAPRLRVATEKYNSLTLSSYFTARYRDSSGMLGLISALICLIFFTFYISSGLVGLGRLFETAFEIDYYIAIFIGLGAAILYTLIGGLVAVAWCDLFQGLFLLAMIIIVPITAYFTLDNGFASIFDAAAAHSISLSLFPSGFFAGIGSALILLLGWGLGYFGQPHILINFMSIDDVKKIRYAKYVGITWQIIALSAAASVGLIGIAYFSQGIANPELIFVIMTKELFPSLLAGFILCGIPAATLSTMDRHILISGSTLAEDIYKEFIHRKASSVHLMWVSRIGSLIISAIALAIAMDNSNSVYGLVNYAWSGLGSSFGPLIIMSLYWEKTTWHGALAGLISGALVAAIWPYINSSILPLLPGFFVGLTTIYFVSLLTQNKK